MEIRTLEEVMKEEFNSPKGELYKHALSEVLFKLRKEAINRMKYWKSCQMHLGQGIDFQGRILELKDLFNITEEEIKEEEIKEEENKK